MFFKGFSASQDSVVVDRVASSSTPQSFSRKREAFVNFMLEEQPVRGSTAAAAKPLWQELLAGQPAEYSEFWKLAGVLLILPASSYANKRRISQLKERRRT